MRNDFLPPPLTIIMKNQTKIILTLLIVCIVSCSPKSKYLGKLNKTIDNICVSNGFSGSILVMFRDSILIDTAYGFEDKTKLIPNSTKTIYPIASVTKLFIKQAILNLDEQGEISLEDTLSEYIDIVMYADKIKISHLLNHQSGLPDIHNRIPRYDNPWLLNYPITPEDLIDTINSFQQLDFTPGSNTGYSNSNYLLMAQIIEKVSGQPLDIFLNENIFITFGLNHTGLYKEHSKIDGHAEGFSTQHGEILYTPDFNFCNFWGSGNAYSTTHDLYSYYKSSQKYLSLKTREQLIQHSGLYTGYRSYYKVESEIGLAIIILSNNSDFNNELIINKISSYLTNELLSTNKKIKSSKYAGKYTGLVNNKEIIAEIKYNSGKYSYNRTELIHIKDDVFLIPNSGFTKITFIQKTDSACKMIINDNGMIMSFSKTQ